MLQLSICSPWLVELWVYRPTVSDPAACLQYLAAAPGFATRPR